LERAAGPAAANLLQQAKGQVAPGVLGAMQRYDFTQDASANVRLVLLQGSVDSAPVGRDRLIVAGNALILAILNAAKDALDAQTTSAFVQDFVDLLAQWQKRPGTTDMQTLILTTLSQTVRQFEQEVMKAGGSKEKGGGILSFLKRR
jgi:hypothetical protein